MIMGNVAEMLQNLRAIKNKKIIIFGTGAGSKGIEPYLPLTISYFVDNNSKKWNTSFLNYEIYNPKVLLEEEVDNIFVLVMSTYYKEISKQLDDYGFTSEIHYCDGYRLFDCILAGGLTKENTDMGVKFSSVRFFGSAFADKKCSFEGNSVIHSGAQIANTHVGAYTYISANTRIYNASIGRFCSLGPEIMIGLGKHPSKGFISTYPAFFSKNNGGCMQSFVSEQLFEEFSPVEIGNDVWIGARTVILDGVKIGDGAIVAAGSVVGKDVEPYSIVGGMPAKLIRKRYSSEQIQKLLDYRWWDKDLEWICKHAVVFSNEEEFFRLIEETSL